MMGGGVKRYHTWPIEQQTVAAHSWGVAMIMQRLYPQCSKALLLAAMQHDLGEQDVGDTPAPAKWRAPELFAQLNAVEDVARLDMGFHPYEETLTDNECHILKLADILELCAFARFCYINGQLSAKIVWENGYSYARKLLADYAKKISHARTHDLGESLLGLVSEQSDVLLAAEHLLDELHSWHHLYRPDVMEEPKLKPAKLADEYCVANRDGDCNAHNCPQLRDNEPQKSGRSCPLKWHVENDD